MASRFTLWNRERRGPAVATMTLDEAMAKYEVVEVTGNAVMVTERPKKLDAVNAAGDTPDLRELGTTGTSYYYNYLREEYNPLLRGTSGLRKYDEMRRSDAQVRATLRLVKTPVLSARWFIEPFDTSRKHRKIADFVWDNLTKWMTVSWPQLLSEILLHLDFGYYTFEKVFTMRDGKVIWQKLAPRHPLDVRTWEFDARGGPKGMRDRKSVV